MGRAGGLLAVLCCLLLGATLPGGAVEAPGEEATISPPTSSHILAVSVEPEVDLSVGTASPPLSSAPKDTGIVLPGTIGPEEEGHATLAVAGTEGPGSVEDGSRKPSTTVVSSRGDLPVEVPANSTAILNPSTTDEVLPTGPSVTVEVVQTTHSPASTAPENDTATLVVTQALPSTTSEPTSSQSNLTEESTQGPSEGVTLQNVTEFGDTTKVLDAVTPVTSTTTVLTSTVSTVTTTTVASTTIHPSADSTSKVSPEDGKHEPSVLDVGDDGQDISGVTNRALSSTDPLVVAVISVFLVMVAILGVAGFLRYRQRNNRTDFRRLQDLPMDDMMEDTPLSLYSY